MIELFFTVIHWLTIGAIVFGVCVLVLLMVTSMQDTRRWKEVLEEEREEERQREEEAARLRKQGLIRITIVERNDSPDAAWSHIRMPRIVKIEEWERMKAEELGKVDLKGLDYSAN